MIRSKLKIVLAKNNITQLELSRRTGIRQPTISSLSLGTMKHIPVNVLDAICKELDCQPGDIVEYVPDEKTPQD